MVQPCLGQGVHAVYQQCLAHFTLALHVHATTTGSKRCCKAATTAYEAQQAAKRVRLGPGTPLQHAHLTEAPLTATPAKPGQLRALADIRRVRWRAPAGGPQTLGCSGVQLAQILPLNLR